MEREREEDKGEKEEGARERVVAQSGKALQNRAVTP